jgi:3-isopropylmalate dehydrogenase
MTSYNIVLLPGDGIGPEITVSVRAVLDAAAARFGFGLTYAEHLIGGAAIDATGEPLPQATLDACLASDAVFLGAVGGPKWGTGKVRPEQGLLQIRKAMGLFANLRPVQVHPSMADRSPLKAEIVSGVDVLIVRELTGGLYFGEKTRTADRASDLCVYTVEEIERVARIAFRAAQGRKGRVASIDKANVIETSRLWRETVTRIGAKEFPDVALEHGLVDSCAMQLILKPTSYDVILTENLFGDILSDEASVLAGSIGLLGSASLGAGGPGLFEPIHGSAPDIAGQDKANPIGSVAAAAMLLREIGQADAAAAVEAAIGAVLEEGDLTGDLGGSSGTRALTRRLADKLATPG